MKKQDFFLILLFAIIFLPFVLSSNAYDLLYHKENGLNTLYPLLTSFVKFAILATLGELIGLRIQTGNYYEKGFGILPRAIIWGFLGIAIKIAFVIFYSGTIMFLQKIFHFERAMEIMQSSQLNLEKIMIAFLISSFMNIIFAPVMMTFHKITDTHIINNKGSVKSLFKPIKMEEIFMNLNWKIQWNFVFKKTIPFFWIPAHTITFLMSAEFRVLFAAILGIFLGILLAFANEKKKIVVNN